MNDFKLADLHGNVLIVGNRACGKTFLLNEISQFANDPISIKRDFKTNKIVISSNSFNTNIFDVHGASYFFDDMFCVKNTIPSEEFKSFFPNTRHHDNDVFITSQYLPMLPPFIRENADFILYMSPNEKLSSEVNNAITNGYNVLYNVKDNTYKIAKTRFFRWVKTPQELKSGITGSLEESINQVLIRNRSSLLTNQKLIVSFLNETQRQQAEILLLLKEWKVEFKSANSLLIWI